MVFVCVCVLGGGGILLSFVPRLLIDGPNSNAKVSWQRNHGKDVYLLIQTQQILL
jgi:hypothetical protein